MFKPMVYTDL